MRILCDSYVSVYPIGLFLYLPIVYESCSAHPCRSSCILHSNFKETAYFTCCLRLLFCLCNNKQFSNLQFPCCFRILPRNHHHPGFFVLVSFVPLGTLANETSPFSSVQYNLYCWTCYQDSCRFCKVLKSYGNS